MTKKIMVANRKGKKFDWDVVHTDQGPYHATYGDRTVTAVYTPHGIRQLDSMFIKKIYGVKSKSEADKLRKEIRGNIHLHEVIRDNLLLNLKNRRKSLPDPTEIPFIDALLKG